jgi:hypothetical protein
VPTIATEGQFSFKVYPRESLFEPPHVHVWVANEDVCRIELNGGTYMDDPPPGRWRDILEAYRKHAVAIRAEWDRIHGR